MFAFGAVLYEMVTGKRAFEGKSQLSVASAILERDPALISAARHGIPTALERTIGICLAKDPERRWSTAHDVVLQLSLIADSEADPIKPVARRLTNRVAFTIALLALLVGAGVAGLVARWTRPTPQSSPAIRFSITLPKDAPMALPNPTPMFAVAPDGSAIAYVALLRPLRTAAGDVFSGGEQGRAFTTSGTVPGASSRVESGVADSPGTTTALYVRRMDQSTPERVPGGEEALDPFFSPDGRWLGWFSRGVMKKVMLGGGSCRHHLRSHQRLHGRGLLGD